MKINIEVNNLEELKELCAQLTGGIVVAEPTPTPVPKEEKKKSTKAKAKKASTPGTDSMQDTEPSRHGEQQDSIEDAEEKEVSATANLHPDVTRKQVTDLVKETMKKGRTDVVKTALGRINAAKVTEIPDNLLGVFYTDLEALLGGE
ncbi:hypothetical protein CIRMBP1296_00174 [Enterococcus cecorum]|nr:hypothetical protein CIRMBP1296_00174 [Enterococcus cecorum]